MWSNLLSSREDDDLLNGNIGFDEPDRSAVHSRDKPTHLHTASKASSTKRTYLNVTNMDLHVQSNAKVHHTSEFAMTSYRNTARCKLIVRRGQPFKLTVHFDRAVDFEHDDLELLCSLGDNPSASKGTRISLPVNSMKTKANKNVWHLDLVEKVSKPIGGDTLHLKITPAATAPIGCWTLDINAVVTSESGFKLESGIQWTSFYLLFNPWNKNDSVYMEDEDDLNEYVLNENGKIWKGTHNQLQACAWCYGQFDEQVLDAVLLALELSGLAAGQRGDPVRVSRALVRMANSPDDNGVVQGKWKAPFTLGTAPTAWTGSAAILRAYASSQGRAPVRYGQCWTFAGVVCTMLRALGLPCRVVTNYSSAHDTDGSCTVDLHFDATTGDVIKELARDSVWNFHVWNDCWMRRPDLPPGNDGWQVLDATPQERSQASGMYQVGPAPVSAVRCGAIGLQFDTAFVFAEVNADKVYWLVDKRTGKTTFLKTASDQIGRKMITKKKGRDVMTGDADAVDIRNVYKHDEGTQEERAALFNALLLGRADLLRYYEGVQSDDQKKETCKIEFDLDLAEQCDLGNDLKAKLSIKNHDSIAHDIKAVIQVHAAEYTGASSVKLFDQFHKLRVNPESETHVSASVAVGKYAAHLSHACAFKVNVMAVVLQSGAVFTVEDDCRLALPTVDIQAAVAAPGAVDRELARPRPDRHEAEVLRVSPAGAQVGAVPDAQSGAVRPVPAPHGPDRGGAPHDSLQYQDYVHRIRRPAVPPADDEIADWACLFADNWYPLDVLELQYTDSETIALILGSEVNGPTPVRRHFPAPAVENQRPVVNAPYLARPFDQCVRQGHQHGRGRDAERFGLTNPLPRHGVQQQQQRRRDERDRNNVVARRRLVHERAARDHKQARQEPIPNPPRGEIVRAVMPERPNSPPAPANERMPILPPTRRAQAVQQHPARRRLDFEAPPPQDSPPRAIPEHFGGIEQFWEPYPGANAAMVTVGNPPIAVVSVAPRDIMGNVLLSSSAALPLPQAAPSDSVEVVFGTPVADRSLLDDWTPNTPPGNEPLPHQSWSPEESAEAVEARARAALLADDGAGMASPSIDIDESGDLVIDELPDDGTLRDPVDMDVESDGDSDYLPEE